MAKQLKIEKGEKWIAFEPESGTLSTSVFSFPAGLLAGGSCRIPWQLHAGEIPSLRGEIQGEHLILSGENQWFGYQVDFFFDQHLFLRGRAIFTAFQNLASFCGSISIPVPDDARFVMPMSLYNDNPSADKDHLVPHFPRSGEASLVLEESRFPIPGVSAEFDGQFFSMFVIPGNGCALGAERSEAGNTACVITSGCVALNGKHDEAYEFKCRSVYHPKGYRELEEHAEFEIAFALNWGAVEYAGEGFRDLVRSGWKLFDPKPEMVLSVREMISRKLEDLDRFAYPGGGYSCVQKLNLYNRKPYFLFGWAGQYCRMALCDIRYGFDFAQPERIERGISAIAFFIRCGKTAVKGLFHTVYDTETQQWKSSELPGETGFPARALGESFTDIARCVLFCREHGIACPDSFEEAVRDGLNFMFGHLLPEGVTPVMYLPDASPGDARATSAGTGVISGFFIMYRLTGEQHFLDRGILLLENYWKLGGDHYDTPFSHATLDAGCEDKEAGIPFFTAAALAWELTNEKRFLHMAESSADWLLTWVYFWQVPFREESICRYFKFNSCGWPAVSVENQHLDVFFPAWEMFRFGLKSGIDLYRKAGLLVFKAWSHGISGGNGDWLMPYRGMQAEQFFQTDWRFSRKEAYDSYPDYFKEQLAKFGYSSDTVDEKNLSGGCNPWQISWITALVLDAALSFDRYAEAHGTFFEGAESRNEDKKRA